MGIQCVEAVREVFIQGILSTGQFDQKEILSYNISGDVSNDFVSDAR